MGTTYRIFEHNTEIGITKDGGTLEWSRGCNGERHGDMLVEIFYGVSRKDVVYAVHLIDIDRGACDKTCGHKDLGFFHCESRHDTGQELVAKTARTVPS